MPLLSAPSKQEPPWFGRSLFVQPTFGQSTTRNMVGASDELSIPSDTIGKSASSWLTADRASLGSTSEGLTSFLNLAHPDGLGNTALENRKYHALKILRVSAANSKI